MNGDDYSTFSEEGNAKKRYTIVTPCTVLPCYNETRQRKPRGEGLGFRLRRGENIMKKLLVFVLAIMLVCGGMISASQASSQGFYEYRLLADGTVEITRVSDECADKMIPAELDGKTVSSIAENAFMGCLKLKDVVIPEGVTSVGNYAFAWCYNLTSVTIPDSVTFFGEGVFESCMKMKSISISREHPALAMSNGALIRKEDKTLLYITGIKGNDYEIPWGITKIGTGAFSESKLKSIVIPDSVTSIGANAFGNCSNLTDIYIPNSVKEFSIQAFRGCRKLKAIRIPNSVTNISEGTFDGCTSLTSIEIDPDHPVYEVTDGALIRKKNRELIYYAGVTKGTFEIPDGIRALGYFSFHSNTSLKEVIIPFSVKEIGGMAFCDCKNLTKATLSAGIKTISYGAFQYCGKLKEVVIPVGVEEIERSAFGQCKSLVEVTLPIGLRTIQSRAFEKCTNLTKVVIPTTVKSIEADTFDGCTKLVCTVSEGSYAKKFCEENNISFVLAE